MGNQRDSRQRDLAHRDLTTGPIGSHLLALAVPAAMGMIFNTLYNLTDFWFAGKLSDNALAGVSIAGSVFFLILSGSFGMQTGTTAIIATEVGKGNTESVISWLDQATGLGLMLSVLCLSFRGCSRRTNGPRRYSIEPQRTCCRTSR